MALVELLPSLLGSLCGTLLHLLRKFGCGGCERCHRSVKVRSAGQHQQTFGCVLQCYAVLAGCELSVL